MERKVLLVCCTVGLLGLLSAAAGFGAERTRIKRSQITFVSATQCGYPDTPAFGLGVTAAVALMLAQTTINVSTGCNSCKRRPQPSNSNSTVALLHIVFYCSALRQAEMLNKIVEFIVLLSCQFLTVLVATVISLVRRLTFGIAVFLLLGGAAFNHRLGREIISSDSNKCYFVKPGVFAGGAILSFVSVVFGTVYYVNLNSARNTDMSWGGSIPNQGEIGMGQPRIPPTQSG